MSGIFYIRNIGDAVPKQSESNTGTVVGTQEGEQIVKKKDGKKYIGKSFAKTKRQFCKEEQKARREEADPERAGKPETEK